MQPAYGQDTPDPYSDPGMLERAVKAVHALGQRDPIREVPDYYLDPSQMPRETFGAQALKNVSRAFSAAAPPPVHVPGIAGTPGMDLDASGGLGGAAPAIGSMGKMGDLEKAFAGSRVGRMVGDIRPWEMHPDDWVRHMRDNIDPRILSNIKAMQESGVGKTFSQIVNPREIYSEITGARAADLAGSSNPAEINQALAKMRGIQAPNLEMMPNVPAAPRNEIMGRDYPSARPRGKDFPQMPAYGDYDAGSNSTRIFTLPKKVMMPGANQENIVASTVAHELEHANDFQKGLLRPRDAIEALVDDWSGHEPYRPGVSRSEVNASEIPRGPAIWQELTGPRADLLKKYGQTNGVPDRFAPARSPKNQYDLQWLAAQNPGAVERIGSRGHFATLDNFETDWALKSMAQQALREGREVNPAILQQFPDLKNTQVDIDSLIKRVIPKK